MDLILKRRSVRKYTEEALRISKFVCEYRAVRREELTDLLLAAGCRNAVWKFPEETGFYQPIVVAAK